MPEDNAQPEKSKLQFKIVVNKDGTKDLVFPDGAISKDISNPNWEETIKTTDIYKIHKENIDWIIEELKDNPDFPLPKKKAKKPLFYSSDVAGARTEKEAFAVASLSEVTCFFMFCIVTMLNAPSKVFALNNINGVLPWILGFAWSLWLAFKWTSDVTTLRNWKDWHELEQENNNGHSRN